MITCVETITPEVAKKILEKNDGNRKLRSESVVRYAEEMKKGHWSHTHQGIAISEDGELLDGQHRLSAVVMSGVSVEMNVSRNCKKEKFAMMDIGISRTASDTVGLTNPQFGLCNAIVLVSDMPSKRKIAHIDARKMYDHYKSDMDLLTCTYRNKGVTALVRVGLLAYVVETGDYQKVRAFTNYMYTAVHNDSITRSMSNFAMFLLKNKDARMKEVSYMAYKCMKNDSLSIVRVDAESVKKVVQFCNELTSKVFYKL